MRAWIIAIIVVGTIAASSTSSSEPATSTSSVAPSSLLTTTLPSPTTTLPPPTTTTTTLPAPIPAFPEFRIAERVVAPETGDIVVLLLDPTSYTSLSDLDLYDIIADAVDRFPPIYEAHIVDTPEAAAAVLVEEPDSEQQRELAAHYLARLEDGYRIVYLGPFGESDEAVLGS